jgi:hypothetical protein
MASTGKNEIKASVFAIASNDFMEEYTDKEEDTHKEEPTNQPAEVATREAQDEDSPQRCKRGNGSGKKKICLTFSAWS